jgi:hypothetical protein
MSDTFRFAFFYTGNALVMLQTLLPVLMRCRAFLPHGVNFSFVNCDGDTTVCLDKVRLSQIITNGLRCVEGRVAESGYTESQADVDDLIVFICCSNAGKFTTRGEVRVVISIIRVVNIRPAPERASMSASATGSSRSHLSVIKAPLALAASRRMSRVSQAQGSNMSRLTAATGGRTNDEAKTPRNVVTTTEYVCVTISNTRNRPVMSKPEECFIPFKQKDSGECLLVHCARCGACILYHLGILGSGSLETRAS